MIITSIMLLVLNSIFSLEYYKYRKDFFNKSLLILILFYCRYVAIKFLYNAISNTNLKLTRI